jgi:hypothetical protein
VIGNKSNRKKNKMAFTDTIYFKVGRTLLKTFVATALGQLVVIGAGVLEMGLVEWKAILAAALAAVILTGYNALNPNYNS